MTLHSFDLRRHCATHRQREPCFICGKHEDITEAHHAKSLEEVAHILNHCADWVTIEEPPIVWLCPNCHTYIHNLMRGKLVWYAFTEDELRRAFTIDVTASEYMRKQFRRWGLE